MSAGYNAARLVLSSGRPVRLSSIFARFFTCLGTRLGARLAVIGVLATAAACIGSVDSLENAGDNPNSTPGAPACGVDADCVAAGPTCCACPTFALTIYDPVARACAAVKPECGPSDCTDNVVARCSEGRCELACKPLSCGAASCPYGFVADMNGCLTCECAAPPPGGCAADGDCVQTRADCCGCARGGLDTAVLASERSQFDANLNCSASPACPGVSTCTTDEPTCVQGRCVLASRDLPAGACGRSDLPPCASGLACIVNASDQANMHGVGVCGEPP